MRRVLETHYALRGLYGTSESFRELVGILAELEPSQTRRNLGPALHCLYNQVEV